MSKIAEPAPLLRSGLTSIEDRVGESHGTEDIPTPYSNQGALALSAFGSH